MSDQERGAYTPPTSDAPLSFDPRQPVRGARPIPFTLILGALVLAALVAAIFMFYQSGVRQAGEAPPTVGQPLAAIKEPAPPSAQPQDPAAGLQIYQSDSGEPLETAPTFAPPPEQPQPRPTQPVVVTQAPPARPAPTATAQPIKPAIPATQPPAEKAAPPPPEKKAPAPEPNAASGGVAVQIGAVSSTALADRAWKEAVAAAPGLAAGKGKSVERIERDGGALYRTAVTGFASRADAQAFCNRLKAAGKACFVR